MKAFRREPLVSRELSLTDTEFKRKLRLVNLEPTNLTYAASNAHPGIFHFSLLAWAYCHSCSDSSLPLRPCGTVNCNRSLSCAEESSSPI